jgi:hypothetical protein
MGLIGLDLWVLYSQPCGFAPWPASLAEPGIQPGKDQDRYWCGEPACIIMRSRGSVDVELMFRSFLAVLAVYRVLGSLVLISLCWEALKPRGDPSSTS